jgi:outer membrane protein assembly factor BamB
MLPRWLFAVLLLLGAPHFTAAQEWARFRGPNGSGISSSTDVPLEWNATKNVRWRTPLPAPGNSSPILWGDHVYLTVATDNGHARHLLCIDRHTGQELWRQTVDFAADEVTHETNPQCSPSPTADAQRVVVWHGSAGVHAYTHEGKPLWSRDLGPVVHIWGIGSSPVLDGDAVFLNFGPGVNSSVVALDAATGEIRWQRDEPGGASGLEPPAKEGGRAPWIGSWSTPILATIDGQAQLIVSLPQHVQGYDPATGDVLWRCQGLTDLVYTSVVLGDDVGIAMGGFRGPALGWRLGGQGDITTSHRLWWDADKNPQRIGSGVVIGPHLFMANEPGIAECIDTHTGNQLWQARLPGGNLWGSLVLAAGRLYVTNQAGDTIVFAPNPQQFELLAVNPLGESSNSTPAITGNQIFLRTFEALYCLEQQ